MPYSFDELLLNLNENAPINDDRDFNTWARDTVKIDSGLYSEILRTYKNNLLLALRKKRTFKQWVFWISLAILITSFILTVIVIFVFSKKLGVIASGVASLLTVYLTIPKIISDYLFNKDEEKYMCEIIKNIQKYDLALLDPVHEINDKDN